MYEYEKRMSTMKKLYIAFGLFFLAIKPSFALDCNKAMTQQDMNMCAGQALKQSDKKLNSAYQSLMGKSKDAQYKNALKQAQRSWIKYRDDDCKLAALPSTGGSVQSMAYSGCLTEKTDQRVAELNKMMTCEEGDVTCNR